MQICMSNDDEEEEMNTDVSVAAQLILVQHGLRKSEYIIFS